MDTVTREVWEITSGAEWLDRRKADITASRLAALFSLHPYLSLVQLADIMRATTSAGTGELEVIADVFNDITGEFDEYLPSDPSNNLATEVIDVN